MVTEGGGYILEWPGMFDACCCTKPVGLGRSHVTGLVFAREAPFMLGTGIWAERGALGHVVGPWGLEPSSGWLVVGPGGCVEQHWGEGWV